MSFSMTLHSLIMTPSSYFIASINSHPRYAEFYVCADILTFQLSATLTGVTSILQIRFDSSTIPACMQRIWATCYQWIASALYRITLNQYCSRKLESGACLRARSLRLGLL